MRAGRAALQHRALCRLHRHDAHGGILRLQILGHAGQRAAGAHARHEDVHLAVGILPDFGAGGAAVHGGVGRVGKLVGDQAARDLLMQLLRPGDGALHAQRAVGQHQLRAIGLNQRPPLGTHAVGHHDQRAVAARRRHPRQADARVAAGGLDDGAARFERAARLRRVQHGAGGAVLDAPGGVERLQLGGDRGVQAVFAAVAGQCQQRGMTDEFGQAAVHLHRKNASFIYCKALGLIRMIGARRPLVKPLRQKSRAGLKGPAAGGMIAKERGTRNCQGGMPHAKQPDTRASP